jgi:RNA polymerase sigma factor (sigma-70 family)
MEEEIRSFDEDAILKMFIKDVCNISTLRKEEELSLAMRVKDGDAEAMDCLIESNLRWVLKIVFQMWRPGLPLLDMISEGCIGLCQAAKSFDPDRGYRLTTFADRPIKWRIRSFVAAHKGQCLESLDEIVFREDGETTRKDLLAADEIAPDQLCFRDDVRDLLDRLNDRERNVVKLRFWEDKSYSYIGALLGLSKNRVGQIEARALRKIRWSIYKEPTASEAYALS